MASNSNKFTRGRFLKALGAFCAYCLTLSNAAGCDLLPRVRPTSGAPRKVIPLPGITPSPPKGIWAFRSRPDLAPAALEITTRELGASSSSYIFLALKEGAGEHGPMILDDEGNLLWYEKYTSARDFKMQYFRGEPVLTWWEGRVYQGHGIGEYVIFDNSYQEIARVRAANGLQGDLHEFLITPEDTALLTAYAPAKADLSSIGGAKDGPVWDCVAQEIDIESGEVLFEWHSLDHVKIEESYVYPPKDKDYLYDYFHINSIEVDHDKNLLLSARNTWSVYKIDRKSGELMWRLGGKKSDFSMGKGTRTAFQHDARRHTDGTLSIFDNGAHPIVHDQSRAIVLEVDEDKMSANLLRAYTSPERLISTSQGNAQLLAADKKMFVGWGSQPYITEFSYDGELLLDGHFPADCESYRAFRFEWRGEPKEEPAVVVEHQGGASDKVKLYASWNGATEVDSWEVLSGEYPGNLEPLGEAPWSGFETPMVVESSDTYFAVRAKESGGRILGTSAPLKL